MMTETASSTTPPVSEFQTWTLWGPVQASLYRTSDLKGGGWNSFGPCGDLTFRKVAGPDIEEDGKVLIHWKNPHTHTVGLNSFIGFGNPIHREGNRFTFKANSLSVCCNRLKNVYSLKFKERMDADRFERFWNLMKTIPDPLPTPLAIDVTAAAAASNPSTMRTVSEEEDDDDENTPKAAEFDDDSDIKEAWDRQKEDAFWDDSDDEEEEYVPQSQDWMSAFQDFNVSS